MKQREKVFGPGQQGPLDRNAKVRIEVYARARNAHLKQGRQHRGPLTGRALDVLNVLVWTFHNAKSGQCYPSYTLDTVRAMLPRGLTRQDRTSVISADVIETWD